MVLMPRTLTQASHGSNSASATGGDRRPGKLDGGRDSRRAGAASADPDVLGSTSDDSLRVGSTSTETGVGAAPSPPQAAIADWRLSATSSTTAWGFAAATGEGARATTAVVSSSLRDAVEGAGSAAASATPASPGLITPLRFVGATRTTAGMTTAAALRLRAAVGDASASNVSRTTSTGRSPRMTAAVP